MANRAFGDSRLATLVNTEVSRPTGWPGSVVLSPWPEGSAEMGSGVTLTGS